MRYLCAGVMQWQCAVSLRAVWGLVALSSCACGKATAVVVCILTEHGKHISRVLVHSEG